MAETIPGTDLDAMAEKIPGTDLDAMAETIPGTDLDAMAKKILDTNQLDRFDFFLKRMMRTMTDLLVPRNIIFEHVRVLQHCYLEFIVIKRPIPLTRGQLDELMWPPRCEQSARRTIARRRVANVSFVVVVPMKPSI